MRQVGSLDDGELAERFASHLRAMGISATVDRVESGYRIWVHDENRIADAKAEFPLFLAEPDHQRYEMAEDLAMERAREDAIRQRASRGRTVNVAERWSRPANEGAPVTIFLVVACVATAILTGLFQQQMNPERVMLLQISNNRSLNQVMHGEVWRLVTPIFLHFNLMHIVFNMMMLYQFGLLIESRIKSFRFAAMVIVIGVVSNLAQFYASGPLFGGMSGVVYGLFGYVWIKSKIDPESGYWLPPQSITTMLVWFVICAIGVLGNVANWAHGGGLAMGIVIAYVETQFQRFARPK